MRDPHDGNCEKRWHTNGISIARTMSFEGRPRFENYKETFCIATRYFRKRFHPISSPLVREAELRNAQMRR